MAGSQGYDPMAFPPPGQQGGMPITMQPYPGPTLANRPGMQSVPYGNDTMTQAVPAGGPQGGGQPPIPFGPRPGGPFMPGSGGMIPKPMPGTPGNLNMNLDQWGPLLPPRLQQQVAAGLPLEQAVGRFVGQLQGDQSMPAWQNPLVQKLMSGAGRPGSPMSPIGVVQDGPGEMAPTPEASPMPAGQPAPATSPAAPPAQANLLTAALARQARPRFDPGVRGGGYDWRADRDRALGQGAFAPKPTPGPNPEIQTPIDPVATKPKPGATDVGKPSVFTKPAPKPRSGRRLPGGY